MGISGRAGGSQLDKAPLSGRKGRGRFLVSVMIREVEGVITRRKQASEKPEA